jgi:hypothetical protein
VVKDGKGPARVELQAVDAAGNSALASTLYTDLHLRMPNGKSNRLTRTITKVAAETHYVTLLNGSTAYTNARLWVNGKRVFNYGVGSDESRRVDVLPQLRPGKKNTVRVTVSARWSNDLALLIGDGSLKDGSVVP